MGNPSQQKKAQKKKVLRRVLRMLKNSDPVRGRAS